MDGALFFALHHAVLVVGERNCKWLGRACKNDDSPV
jgi:hypothetical protein